MSLSLRIRDLVLDPAGLLTLQQVESRRYFKRRNASGDRGRMTGDGLEAVPF